MSRWFARTDDEGPIPGARAHVRELALLFVVALALRLVALQLLLDPAEIARSDAWTFGYESACLGESLANGHGFAGQWHRAQPPWDAHAPTSAWLTPIYPAFLAVALKLGGGVTVATAWIVLGVQSVLSALTCLFLWGMGAALRDLRLARVAGWLFAIWPSAIWNSAHFVWDTTAAGCALALVVELFLRFGPSARFGRAVYLGAAYGVMLLVSASGLAIAPALAWLVTRGAQRREQLVRLAACTGAALLVVAPWCIRNGLAVGSWNLRSNLGVEFLVGNNDVANGYFQPSVHASYQPKEFERYVELGEKAYAKESLHRALEWMRANPGRWLTLTLRRVQLFWVGDYPPLDPRRDGERSAANDPKSWIKWVQHASLGLASLAGAVLLARRTRGGRMIAVILLLFPVPYYLTHVMERYRFPIEPLLALCAAALLVALLERVRPRAAS